MIELDNTNMDCDWNSLSFNFSDPNKAVFTMCFDVSALPSNNPKEPSLQESAQQEDEEKDKKPQSREKNF